MSNLENLSSKIIEDAILKLKLYWKKLRIMKALMIESKIKEARGAKKPDDRKS